MCICFIGCATATNLSDRQGVGETKTGFGRIADNTPFIIDKKAIAKKIHDDQVFIQAAVTDDWEEPHYKVYAVKGDSIEPEETLNMLKRLRDIYAGRTDKDSVNRANKVINLIEASQISADKCNLESLTKLNKLIEYNSAYRINVVPYLDHYIGQQFRICRPMAAFKLNEALGKIPKDHLEGVTIIHKHMSKSRHHDKPKSDTPGVLDFMEELNNQFDTVQVGAKRGAGKFQFKLVATDLCSTFNQGLDEAISVYEQLLRNQDTATNVDEHELYWVNTYKTCQRVLKDPEAISLDAYQALFERYNRALEEEVRHPPSGEIKNESPGDSPGLNEGSKTRSK